MAFSKEMVQQVWEQGRGTQDQDPTLWRKDECGAWMRREHYDSAHSEYGWKIENVSPGGPETLENLRPFHRENSFDRGAQHPRCQVTADQKKVDTREHIVDRPRNAAVKR